MLDTTIRKQIHIAQNQAWILLQLNNWRLKRTKTIVKYIGTYNSEIMCIWMQLSIYSDQGKALYCLHGIQIDFIFYIQIMIKIKYT